MHYRTKQMLLWLIRSALEGKALTESERAHYISSRLPQMTAMAGKHDIAHLLALGLKQNDLLPKDDAELNKSISKAVYRYGLTNIESGNICNALEKAGVPFMPLKGMILRDYYPEAWMRTSCDIDILVHKEDMDKAIAVLTETCGCTYYGKSNHDVSYITPRRVHIELHYDLIEDGRVNKSTEILKTVWTTAVVRKGYNCWYEMTDEMFYFYHIVHMAKHFTSGGCGIRPIIDHWFLEKKPADRTKREALLQEGQLLQFTAMITKLCNAWFEGAEMDADTLAVETFILYGGVYGNAENAAMIKSAKGESKLKSFFNLMFLPRNNLEDIYPQLKEKPALFPFYQVKRWFRIFNKRKRDKITRITKTRNSVSQEGTRSTAKLLDTLGLTEEQSSNKQ